MSDNVPEASRSYPSDETIRAQVEMHVCYDDLERLAEQIKEALTNANRFLVRLEPVTDGYRDPVANGVFFAHRCLRNALYNLRQGQKKIYGAPVQEDPDES